MGIFFCKPAAQTPEDKSQPPYDYYRCSGLRYMGFASVLAGKMVPPQFSQIPNMAATAYVFADVFNKSLASVDNDEDPQRTALTAVDALLWQTMASVIAPLLLYSGLKTATRLALVRKTKPCPMPKPKCTAKEKPVELDKCGYPVQPPTPKSCKPTTPPPPASKCQPPQTPPPAQKCQTPSPQCCPPPPHFNCECRASEYMQANQKFPTPTFLRVFPGIIALALMPFLLQPIHDGVDDLMDATYRKWAEAYLRKHEMTPEQRTERARQRKLKAEQEAKEAEERRKLAEKARLEREKEAARIAAEKAKLKAKEEELAKAQRLKEEKEAKELARKKCLEDEKLRKEKVLAEERAAKEKITQEEAELHKKKTQLEQEFKEKSQKKLDCD